MYFYIDYQQDQVGLHNLTLIVSHKCLNQTFENPFTVNVKRNNPPTNVYSVGTQYVYQGQNEIVVNFENQLFYDEIDELKFKETE
jgi:hypothetical protein